MRHLEKKYSKEILHVQANSYWFLFIYQRGWDIILGIKQLRSTRQILQGFSRLCMEFSYLGQLEHCKRLHPLASNCLKDNIFARLLKMTIGAKFSSSKNPLSPLCFFFIEIEPTLKNWLTYVKIYLVSLQDYLHLGIMTVILDSLQMLILCFYNILTPLFLKNKSWRMGQRHVIH